jgi:2-polyprenyl-3-methyl-5-hydroxy-6-metoxy-1,4-benzoquinol methylase
LLDQGEKAYPPRQELTLDNLDPNTSYAKVLDLVGSAKNILDAGCSSGYLARLLTKRNCTVAGLDINPDALAEAAEYCTHTVAADLDRQELGQLFGAAEFDAIVFADVLEHLRDPWRVLDGARAILVDGGSVIASIPNIAHGAIRLALLSGKFDYSEFGILDDTHLRFFTRRTIAELFIRSGFTIERIERTVLPLFVPSDLVPQLDESSFDPATVATIRRDPECDTLQFVVKGNALSDDAKWAQIKKCYVATNRELDAADEQRFASVHAAPLAADVELRLQRLERENSELRELEARAAEEVLRSRRSSALYDERIAELTSRREELATALSIASHQIDALVSERVALERYCAHLAAKLNQEEATATTAERTVYEYLRDLADDFGNIGDLAAKRASITALRRAYPVMLAQIESLDAALHGAQPKVQKGRRSTLGVSAFCRRSRRLIRRLVRRATFR